MSAGPAIHTRPPALLVHAGRRARAQLQAQGLQPGQVRVVPAAAGGPKGLILNHLDRYLFGHWLHQAPADAPPVHLLGASIGAWRMVSGALADPVPALARLAHEYIHQRFDVPDGAIPGPAEVSRVFRGLLHSQMQGHEAALLAQARFRLHVFTSRGRGPLLRQEGRWRTALGYAGAAATNLASRRGLGAWLQRVVFSDPRTPLPLPLDDMASHQTVLTVDNMAAAVVASGSIPFVLQAVHNIPGAPPGAYWDGGITDYHLHLKYAAMAEGLVLYPHFQGTVVPGWLDKGLRHRHRATPWLDNLVLLSPNPAWVATLPGGKLPDRQDFKTYLNDNPERIRRWQAALDASQQLADEANDLFARPTLQVEPLARG